MATKLDAATRAAQGSAIAEQAEAAGAGPVEVATAVLNWAGDVFGDRLCVLSSMGDEVLVHLVSEVVPGISVIFLDTGYHFAETLGTRDAYEATRPIKIINMFAKQTVAEQDAEFGAKLHDRDPTACCAMRKVEPMNRALEGFDAWSSGMRRQDAPTRTSIGIVEYDAKRDLVKINPLATWTQADVDSYIETNQVILNPLRQLGYASIGCQPCTAFGTADDPRAGRWAGSDKTECGLHI